MGSYISKVQVTMHSALDNFELKSETTSAEVLNVHRYLRKQVFHLDRLQDINSVHSASTRHQGLSNFIRKLYIFLIIWIWSKLKHFARKCDLLLFDMRRDPILAVCNIRLIIKILHMLMNCTITNSRYFSCSCKLAPIQDSILKSICQNIFY